MHRFVRSMAWVFLAGIASPAPAQDVIVFSSNRAFPASGGWETSIYRMNVDKTGLPDQTTLRDLTPGWPVTPQPEWAPAASPDGDWIAVVADGSLWRMRLDNPVPPIFVTGGAMIHTNAWSADGSQIYFSTPGTCAEDIDVVAIDGSGRHRAVDAGVDFPENAAAQVSVSVHDEIAVIGGNCGPGPRNLYLKNPGETPARLLVPYTNLAAWSPDGERLVLARCFPGESCQLWTVNRDGSELRQLTFDAESEHGDPNWSPDGSRIIFSRLDYLAYPYAYSGGHLFVMDATPHATEVQLTFGDQVFDRSPVWIRGNSAPIADAGTAQTVLCAGFGASPVTLDGAASSDPDGDPLTYTWTGPFPEGGGTVTGISPTVTLPLGSSTITLVVNDGKADSAPATVTATVSLRVAGFEPPLGPMVPEGQPVEWPRKAFSGNVVPLKFQTLCRDGVLCGPTDEPPCIVGLQRSGAALDLDALDLDAGQSADSGRCFRPEGSHWVFNLSTKALTSGTYTVTVQLVDDSRWVGGFVLR